MILLSYGLSGAREGRRERIMPQNRPSVERVLGA
jgi:hypothetical protein